MPRGPLRLLTIATMTLACLAATVSAAQAGGTITVDLPSPMLRGQTGLSGSVTIAAVGTPASFACNAVDCGGYAPLNVEPVCGDASEWFFCATPQPGVIALDTTATGRAGSSCAGDAFTVVPDADPAANFTFIRTGGSLLIPAGESCTIDFTFDVTGSPTIDADPGQPGMQTLPFAGVFINTGGGNGTLISTAFPSANGTPVTVITYPTSVTGAATTPATVGDDISTSATLQRGAPLPIGGTVTFDLYGPDDPSCAGPPLFSSTVPAPPILILGVPTAPVLGGSYRTARAGLHQWVVRFSGDETGDAPASESCGDHPQAVAQATPQIQGQASGDVPLGQAISDTAKVSGRVAPGDATIRFSAFGPDDASCSGPAAYTVDVPYGAADDDAQASFTPAASGVYRWRAEYLGDANNAARSTDCDDDAAQRTTVTKAAEDPAPAGDDPALSGDEPAPSTDAAAPPSSTPAPVPAPTTAAPVTTSSPAASSPPPAACRSRRTISIGLTLAVPRGLRLDRAVVRVNNRVVRTLHRGTKRFTLKLNGYPRGVAAVLISARTTSGQRLVGTRSYRLCGYRGRPAKRLTVLHRPGRRRGARRSGPHRVLRTGVADRASSATR